jgi:bifunctional non-homologous end joining protein LigD
MAFVAGGKVRLVTRGGEDWSARFPRVARALAELAGDAVIDGEVVVLDAGGVSDFQRLQNALKEGGGETVFFAFDLPHAGGFDLAAVPLVERKGALERLLAGLPQGGPVRFSEHVAGSGPTFLEHACALGLEGAISKPADARYQAGKRAAWIKTKCLQRQEFVVGGWSEPAGSRQHLGALLVGVHGEDGELRYAGKVGTGFSEASLRELSAKLRPLARKTPPFADPPRGASARGAHWVEPRCVVEVAFTEWTGDGRLRHPSFAGVREDKRPEAVRRERPQRDAALRRGAVAPRRSTTVGAAGADKAKAARGKPPRPSRGAASADVAGVRITHPERVLFPELGATKLDLALYYESAAERLLPHLAGRPLSILRCPEGTAAACFYQKHLTAGFGSAVRGIPVREKEGKRDYLGVDDLQGLIQLVQHGAIELHPWGSRADKIDLPDRLVLDLDPAPDVPWKRVVAAALALRELLEELGLSSFPRTTGGKGLHVVLSLARRAGWDDVKGFARELGAALARRDPEAFVLVATKARRGGRIYVDYLRNARGATAVAPYSVRARPAATVATPLAWKELTTRLDPARFDLRSVPRRLASADPWEGFFEARQALTAGLLARVKRL